MDQSSGLPQTGVELREAVRAGRYRFPTSGVASEFVQTNVAILPRDLAFDFLLFCQRNPKPCPVIEVIEAGRTEARITAPGSDIRTDVPKYRVYRDGRLTEEPDTLTAHWRDDLVTFLLGCSFSFEHALIRNGITIPFFGTRKNVSMYITSIETRPAGVFAGPMVVSMRWIPAGKVVRAVQATSRFPAVHGAPVHIGDPARIGIADLMKPDFGDAWAPASPNDVPVFWACGVTPQAVAMASKPELMLTHAPGHMFVTDLKDEDLAVPLKWGQVLYSQRFSRLAPPPDPAHQPVTPLDRFIQPRDADATVTHQTIEDIVLAHDTRNMTALRPLLSPTFVTDAARAALSNPGRVLVVTGFYIVRAGAPETDGPPGAAVLGRALESLGREVFYVTDAKSHDVVAEVAGDRPVIEFPIAGHEESKAFAARTLSELRPSLVVAIERAGLMGDGTFRNFAGFDFSAFNAKTDYLFDGRVASIGIGDGGNEIGMGNLRDQMRGLAGLPADPCVTRADHLVISSCSNWGAYGLVAALSLLSGRVLLPSVEQGRDWIERIVRRGAVEGISGERKPWVDGRSPEQDDSCLRELHTLLARAGVALGRG